MSEVSVQFDFEACFKLPQSFQVFYNFLEKEEHNTEPLEFLKHVDEFQQKTVELLSNVDQNSTWETQIQTTYHSIYQDFIEDKSPKQLNLDFSKRLLMKTKITEIDTLIGNLKLEEKTLLDIMRAKLHHLFDDVKIVIAFQLQCDSFPRFVRHYSWITFCAENNELVEQFLKKTRFIKMMNTSEFYDPIFNDRDIELAKYFIMDSSKWKQVGSIKCKYNSKQNDCIDFYDFTDPFVVTDIPRLKKVVCHKYTNTMPFHYKNIVYASMGKEANPNIRVLAHHIPKPDQMEHGKYAFATVLQLNKFPLFKIRENLMIWTYLKVRLEDGTKAVLKIVKSIKDETVPLVKKGSIRTELYGCEAYIKISKNCTRMVRAVFLYFGGMLEKFFKLFEKGLQKYVVKENEKMYMNYDKLQSSEFKGLDDSFQFRSLYDYNKTLIK